MDGTQFSTLPIHDAVAAACGPPTVGRGAPHSHSVQESRMTKNSSRACSSCPSMTILPQQLPTQRQAAQTNSVATPSRRDLMSTIGFAALLASSALCFSAQAQQQKIKKSEAKYQDKPNGDQRCQSCQFFQGPNQCQLVEGGISPNGWCERFAAKT